MQVICPQCGEPVSAEQINIQRMAAVCPACHSVFQFEPSPVHAKAKRQKVKQPPRLELDEDDTHLRLAFRTNFRLGENETFLFGVFFSVVFTFITLIISSRGLASPSMMLLAGGFGLVAVTLYYWLALLLYNKTHIEASDEAIRVSRRPLPGLFSQPETIPLAGTEQIRVEETPASKEAGYSTPRYNVWAHTVDGKRRLIVGDLVDDYADFVAQRLNELLDLEPTPNVSRLLDNAWEADETQTPDAFNTSSQSSHS
jgi:hypothetical protein